MTAVPATIPAGPLDERLHARWETLPGIRGVLATVDHKEIGVRYMVTAFGFFCLAGVLAVMMRTQLAVPEATLVDPRTYDQLFTMHGTTMIFFFATPMLSGFGNYFIPLLIGARDMAFPRLNALSYWVFLLSGLFMYTSFLAGGAPDAGWFAYAPLTSRAYDPGLGMDFWTLSIIFLGISSTVGAINFIVTIFKLRAPGLSINRLPLFCWNVLAASFMIVFALPALTTACALLELDRRVGTHFFDQAQGGHPLLWQHLFWIFGHPDVYIMFLPAVGIISEVIPVFARRPIVGYTAVVISTVATAIIGFGVWVHHMFATGLPALSLAFFSAASMAIAIPSGVQVLAWSTTLFTGRLVMRTPMLFAIGFLILFTMGGVTGVMVASVPFDWQITDSYFVVAHFHYVLVGGAVMFPIFAGLHYWLPKVTGRMLNEKLGQLTFWLLFVGFNVTFFPMHIAGLMGMPRRIYTYPGGLGWEWPNFIETIGAYLLGLGVLVFIWNFFQSQRSGARAGNDPWGAPTLEWATTSPPPPYNFARVPIVQARDPLWGLRLVPPTAGETAAMPPAAPPTALTARRESGTGSRGAGRAGEAGEAGRAGEAGGGVAVSAPVLAAVDERYGLLRETPGSTLLDAWPNEMLRMPEDSYWPLVLAIGLAILFIGLLLGNPFGAGAGLVIAAVAIGAWLWPTGSEEDTTAQGAAE